MVRSFLHILIFCCFSGCVKKGQLSESTFFSNQPDTVTVAPDQLDEASGIADSKKNPGYLWVHEDSGNPNQLFLLSHAGKLKKRIRLNGMENRDWEDIALAKGPVQGRNYIYLGDIGNNNFSSTKFYIYRFLEPSATADFVEEYDKIAFTYPDGAHDAEALLVDNRSKDIYVITKKDSLSGIYRLPYPQDLDKVNTAILVGRLPFDGVVSAAFSPLGDEVLVKTYSSIYYWKIGNNHFVEEVLYTDPVKLPYQIEPQGEAIAFKNENDGFFTLSERPSLIKDVKLYFYLRR